MNEITPPVREIIRAQTTYGDFPCLLDANERAIFADQINALLAERDRLKADAYLYHVIRETLMEHGCKSGSEVVHVPHLVNSFLSSLMAIVRKAKELADMERIDGLAQFKKYIILKQNVQQLISAHEQKYGPIGGE